MLDNIADMLLMVALLAATVNFPTNVALHYMIPGTAIGVFVGDLMFFVLAFILARKTGRNDITAMPLGLDTPSTFGMVFFVLAPAYVKALETFANNAEAAAIHTWHIGICAIFISGVFKLLCAFASTWVRNAIPRAGLLGSLAAIAAVVISFLPLLETFHAPVVGMIALAITLTTLVARIPLPFHMPGALGALLVSATMYWLMQIGQPVSDELAQSWASAKSGLLPTEWLTVFRFEWFGVLQESLQYLPIVLPLALATVVGGIDCTESAAAVGDEYDTGQVIAIEAVATLVAAICGGVIQTTPYIGHPAYKAMGGRAAYTLATALFVGGAGVIGYFSFMYIVIPKPTVFPILVFVGLEITAQSFLATPKRHYTAVALALVPALAALTFITCGKFGVTPDVVAKLRPDAQNEFLTIVMLNNGFIITSLIWASALALIIDRRLSSAAVFFGIATALTLFGVMHSPLPGGALYLPWELYSDAKTQSLAIVMFQWATGYAIIAAMLFAWSIWLKRQGIEPIVSDDVGTHLT